MFKTTTKLTLFVLGLSILMGCDIRNVKIHNCLFDNPYEYPPYNGYPVYYNGRLQSV